MPSILLDVCMHSLIQAYGIKSYYPHPHFTDGIAEARRGMNQPKMTASHCLNWNITKAVWLQTPNSGDGFVPVCIDPQKSLWRKERPKPSKPKIA